VTTRVAKGAGRPAAQARTAKHAQRTPLPPKAGVIEDAKAAIAETQRKPSPAALNKTKSNAKAADFAAAAVDAGWVPGITALDEHTTLVARRGEEVIHIEWDHGVFVDSCTYTHAGRTPIKLRNASAAKARMAQPAERAAEEAQRVSAHKVTRTARKSASVGPRRRKLPFSEASLDQEVLDSLYGRQIVWTNRISGADEVDRVPAIAEGMVLRDGTRGTSKQNHPPRIMEYPSGRTLEFVGRQGFRSVLLSSIVRVR
jgi:hypothetical protein